MLQIFTYFMRITPTWPVKEHLHLLKQVASRDADTELITNPEADNVSKATMKFG